MGTEKAKSK